MATGCFLCTWMDGMYFKEMFPLKFLSTCCTKIYCCIPLQQAPLGLWKCPFVHKNHFACPIHFTYKNHPKQNQLYITGFMQRCAKSFFEFEGLKKWERKMRHRFVQHWTHILCLETCQHRAGPFFFHPELAAPLLPPWKCRRHEEEAGCGCWRHLVSIFLPLKVTLRSFHFSLCSNDQEEK